MGLSITIMPVPARRYSAIPDVAGFFLSCGQPSGRLAHPWSVNRLEIESMVERFFPIVSNRLCKRGLAFPNYPITRISGGPTQAGLQRVCYGGGRKQWIQRGRK